MQAHFRWSLVLTYAFPLDVLRPMLGPGLELDAYDDFGFLAIALVQTEGLRPKGLPALFGRDFFLSGYRIFSRLVRPGKQTLRGLRILRSDTDRRSMVWLGNVFTHYGYRLAEVAVQRTGAALSVRVKTRAGEADLDVDADLTEGQTGLPEGSPFRSLKDARRFVGPLPYTFDHEAATGKMVVVRGLRSAWDPRPVSVTVHKASFLATPPLAGATPRLANAFFVENVPYAWKAGTVEDVA